MSKPKAPRCFVKLLMINGDYLYLNSKDSLVPRTELAKAFENETQAIGRYEKLRRTNKLKPHQDVSFPTTPNLAGA